MDKEELLKLVDWFINGDVGSSSTSIVVHMLDLGMKNTPPYDKWDRERCIKLLKLFPQWIKRLDEMNVYNGWEEQVELIKQDLLTKENKDNEKI